MIPYLDSNVFVFASIDSGSRGEHARSILTDIARGTTTAYTSVLSLDEAVSALIKYDHNREQAIIQVSNLLQLKNLTILSCTRELIQESLSIMKQTTLRPRDACHVATARSVGCDVIVTDDADFNTVKNPKREQL